MPNGTDHHYHLATQAWGSPGIVDLAHNAHIFERDITKIEWVDESGGTTHKMGEWFEVCKVQTSSSS